MKQRGRAQPPLTLQRRQDAILLVIVIAEARVNLGSDGETMPTPACTRHGTNPFTLQQAGGWSSLAMPRRYIAEDAIANEGARLGGEE
jgi:hypothetical protein